MSHMVWFGTGQGLVNCLALSRPKSEPSICAVAPCRAPSGSWPLQEGLVPTPRTVRGFLGSLVVQLRGMYHMDVDILEPRWSHVIHILECPIYTGDTNGAQQPAQQTLTVCRGLGVCEAPWMSQHRPPHLQLTDF